MRISPRDLRRGVVGAAMTSGLIAGAGVTPSDAQEPTDPAVAALLGTFELHSGTITLANLSSAKHFRICVLTEFEGSEVSTIGITAISENGEIDIDPGNCGDLEGARIEVQPLNAVARNKSIHGTYKLAD